MQKTIFSFRLFFLCILFSPIGFWSFSVSADDSVRVGDLVFGESFGGSSLPEGWTKPDSRFVSFQDDSFQIDLPLGGDIKNYSVSKNLPVEKIRGKRLRISAWIKADNVAQPPNSWNGIKTMLAVDGPNGKIWPQKSNVYGTFDWKQIVFKTVVPENATSINLVLGLENTTGRVRFRNVEIKVIGVKRNKLSDKIDPDKPVYKGHDLPRLRGAMVSPGQFGPEDIKVLAGDWKANHVRWQLTWAGFPNGPADTATVEQYDDWIDRQCKLLDAILPECKKYGVRVCLDLHTPPGGRMPRNEGSSMRLFHDKRWQDAFVAVWEKLARKYKDEKMIWSYDLLNEPVEGSAFDEREPGEDGILDWQGLALKTSKAIRKIDSETAIVIEADPWGGPDSLEWFEPFDSKEVPHVVYSVHMYIPHEYTHQGVYDAPTGLVYPGKISDKHWDKEALRQSLRVPIQFAKTNGVHIYLGEFSAIRWAPGGSAVRYLKDCIEIFEEEDWDWAYHAFREWNGWSVEHGPDKNDDKPAAEPTDRELLLRSWFEKNER